MLQPNSKQMYENPEPMYKGKVISSSLRDDPVFKPVAGARILKTLVGLVSVEQAATSPHLPRTVPFHAVVTRSSSASLFRSEMHPSLDSKIRLDLELGIDLGDLQATVAWGQRQREREARRAHAGQLPSVPLSSPRHRGQPRPKVCGRR